MTAKLAILIPTYLRAEQLPPLIDNIRVTTAVPYHVYLIMEAHDQDSIRTSMSFDTTDVIGKFGSCSLAMNTGFIASREEFVFTGNDDLRFHHGWAEAALAKMDDDHHIVGTNDGSGDCKCFAVARRSYIEEHSGVYDRPGTLWHTYKSQGPDTEFAHYAMLRGVWAEAPDAVTEHVHHRWGKADPDHPNYQKARDTVEDDLAEYRRRRAVWDPKGVTPMAVSTI